MTDAGGEPEPREPIASIDRVVELIREARNVLILTGAGVSTSCGIPDFRGENGIYARLKTDYPTLPDPQVCRDLVDVDARGVRRVCGVVCVCVYVYMLVHCTNVICFAPRKTTLWLLRPSMLTHV